MAIKGFGWLTRLFDKQAPASPTNVESIERPTITVFPKDESNQFVFDRRNRPIRLLTRVNAESVKDKAYMTRAAARAVLQGIGSDQVGINDLSKMKSFDVSGVAKPISSAQVFVEALFLLNDQERGHKWLGEKTGYGVNMLQTALNESLRPVRDSGFAATRHMDLVS